MTKDGYDHLKVEISEGIAIVGLNRADKRNAVNRKMLSELLPGEPCGRPDGAGGGAGERRDL